MAAQRAEDEWLRQEREASMARHQRQTRSAAKRALARNGIPLATTLILATVGMPLLRAYGDAEVALTILHLILVSVLPFASGLLAGRTVTRLIVLRRQQAPWKINLDSAFDWRSIWAAILVMAATGYLAWSSLPVS